MRDERFPGPEAGVLRSGDTDPESLSGEAAIFCPGCPRRGVFLALAKMQVFAEGDVTCHTIGALPPPQVRQVCIALGADPGKARGSKKGMDARKERMIAATRGKVVKVVQSGAHLDLEVDELEGGESNGAGKVVVLLDNSTSDGMDADGLRRGLGIEHSRTVDPHDVGEIAGTLRDLLLSRESALVVAKAPCVLGLEQRESICRVDSALCIGCNHCLKVGCPALVVKEDTEGIRKAEILATECVGCGICIQLCREGAIEECAAPGEGKIE